MKLNGIKVNSKQKFKKMTKFHTSSNNNNTSSSSGVSFFNNYNNFNTINNSNNNNNNNINNSNNKNKMNYKLPILTNVELINNDTNDNSKNNKTKNNKNSRVLYQDYVLIQSNTKYKHLLHTVLEQIDLENKNEYQIFDGKFKIINY